eukprot:scaffold33505_cov101-Skeletonema_dohrnii-CCMP3373.AAC.4
MVLPGNRDFGAHSAVDWSLKLLQKITFYKLDKYTSLLCFFAPGNRCRLESRECHKQSDYAI